MANPDPREAILGAAARLFCARGFHAVGTNDICAAAGVLKGTLYHFFASKAVLAVAVLERYGATVCGQFAAAVAGRAGAARKLSRVFEAVRRSAATQRDETGVTSGCLHGNLASELAGTEPSVREVLVRIGDAWAAVLAGPIAELMRANAIPPGDPLDAARTVLAFLSGAMLAAKTANDPDLIARQGRNVLRLLGGVELAPLP